MRKRIIRIVAAAFAVGALAGAGAQVAPQYFMHGTAHAPAAAAAPQYFMHG